MSLSVKDQIESIINLESNIHKNNNFVLEVNYNNFSEFSEYIFNFIIFDEDFQYHDELTLKEDFFKNKSISDTIENIKKVFFKRFELFKELKESN